MSNTHTPCTLARFEQIVEAYGGEPEGWPSAEREAALALVQREPRARALQAAALQLDAQLGELLQPELSPRLRARVLEVPIRHPREPAGVRRYGGMRLMLLACVPCVLGFISGAWLQSTNQSDDSAWNEAPLALLDDALDEEEEL